ncbi:MAG: hypothetical protein LBO72_05800 [Helicobacteraceae bacterium]|jgi:spermidine synthase|nr:hypothetical protein [Helicobacteraceae bacterium]
MKTIVAETAAHIPLCVIDEAKSALVLGDVIDKTLIDEMAKHKIVPAICSLRAADFDYDQNITWKTGSISINATDLEGAFDLIVDLRAQKPNADEAQKLLAKLTDRGVLLKAFGVLEQEQLKAYRSRRFVMPCALSAFAPLDGAISGFVFASDKFHPIADLKLQKADMLDRLSYYSSDTHNAAFAIPPYILARFDELIKN